ncbi:hypothetical protein B0H13DRAFT_2329729 [Mycena leptocephala]|nr:hypothetical protein B0H13DRAFT_2329729 [Mycena leptocephala]
MPVSLKTLTQSCNVLNRGALRVIQEKVSSQCFFHANLAVARRHNGWESTRTADTLNDVAALAGHGHELPDPALGRRFGTTTNGKASAQQTNQAMSPGHGHKLPEPALTAQGAVFTRRYCYQQTPSTSVFACMGTLYTPGPESRGGVYLANGYVSCLQWAVRARTRLFVAVAAPRACTGGALQSW